MKNLVLLTEHRHVFETCEKIITESNPTATSDNTSTSCADESLASPPSIIVSNPNVNREHFDQRRKRNISDDFNDKLEDDVQFGVDEDIYEYILTGKGYLTAIDSLKCPGWEIDLSALSHNNYDEYEDLQDEYVDDKNDQGDHVRDYYFDLYYNENIEALVALSRSQGRIVTIDPTSGIGELVGSFDEFGLLAGKWSDDGEILALITLCSQEEQAVEEEIETDEAKQMDMNPSSEQRIPILMTMNTNFEILTETELPTHCTSEPMEICWKADGTLLAISSVDPVDISIDKGCKRRTIRFYSSETLEMKCTGRTEDGSGKILTNILSLPDERGEIGTHTLAWGGSEVSELLACVRRKSKKSRDIIFLEPNGLQHGNFNLKQFVIGDEVIGLTFNNPSDLLAVTLRNKDTHSRGDRVQFYHRCNYHWYLKYELSYDQKHGRNMVGGIQFDDINPYLVMVTLLSNNYNNAISTSTTQENIEYGKPNVNGQIFTEWRQYKFAWDTSTTSYDNTACVIDGNALNLTPLDRAIIPPPMFAHQIQFDAPIIGVACIPPSCCHVEMQQHSPSISIDSVLQLSNSSLAFCILNPKPTIKSQSSNTESNKNQSSVAKYSPPNIVTTFDLTQCWGNPSLLRQFTIIKVDKGSSSSSTTSTTTRTIDFMDVRLLAISCQDAHSASTNCFDQIVDIIIRINLNEDSNQAVQLIDTNSYQLEHTVLRMVHWSDEIANSKAVGGALIELTDGTLFEFTSSNNSPGSIIPFESEPLLLEPCPWIAGLLNVNNNESKRPLIFGLSSRYRLYNGEHLLSDGSTSFSLSPSYSFISHITLGSRSQLRFLPLDVLATFDPLAGSDHLDPNALGEGYEPRAVERGAQIVSISSFKPMVVMQLPRGNLEAICPRALLIPFVMGCVENGKYDLAVVTMRKQRMDTNLIVDMNPYKFLNNGGAESLIKQIGTSTKNGEGLDLLNLFIASLANTDITQWKYIIPSWYKKKQNNMSFEQTPFDFNTKVNQVCIKLREVMLDAEENDGRERKFLQPILSTFAKEDPPKLESALSLILRNALFVEGDVENFSRKKKKLLLLGDAAQNSIRYLAFLADYELIYDTALGMYDFDLARAVARNSQMDPKVYIPYLKRLTELPSYAAKFEVDVRLKRYEFALRNLIKIPLEGSDDQNSNGPKSAIDMPQEHFDKCLSFIEKHDLHRLGLQLFPDEKPQLYCSHKTDEETTDRNYRRCIMLSLGERFLRQNKAEIALPIFLAANPSCFDGAKRAARACGDWKTYFACQPLLPQTIDDNTQEAEERSVRFHAVAEEIAEEVASGKSGSEFRKEGYAAAARILLDYCQDYSGAVSMLISGELWFEARRIACLCLRENVEINNLRNSTDKTKLNLSNELKGLVIDAAKTYAQSCISDFETRAEIFINANNRYATVLNIRRKVKKDEAGKLGETMDDGNVESGSLFSMASTASNASILSSMSSNSVATVSSVISAGAVSSFSIIGEDESMKHKSKFSKGGKAKKKRKPKRERNKMKRGSEDELKSLISTLKQNIVDQEYASTISETIQFLIQEQNQSLALETSEAYEELFNVVHKSQRERIEADKKERFELERNARLEGLIFEHVQLGCEQEVNDIKCHKLDDAIIETLVFFQ